MKERDHQWLHGDTANDHCGALEFVKRLLWNAQRGLTLCILRDKLICWFGLLCNCW